MSCPILRRAAIINDYAMPYRRKLISILVIERVKILNSFGVVGYCSDDTLHGTVQDTIVINS